MKRVHWKKYLLLVGVTAVFTVAGAVTSFAKTKLDAPTNTYWSNTTKSNDDHEKDGTIARWDEVDDAYNYLVYLYHEDSDSYYKKKVSKKNYVNLRSLMDKEGDYYFKVKAQAKNNSKEFYDSSWSEESDVYYMSASGAANAGEPEEQTAFIVSQAGWVQDDGGWWYRNANGTYPYDGWFQDPADGNWYYLNDQGYVVTGWVEDNGRKYYLDGTGTPYGVMLIGDYIIDGVEYHFDTDGALIE